MGRGTTIIEATLAGRAAIGNDINPLSTLLSRPRTDIPNIAEIQRRLSALAWDHDVSADDPLLTFYHPDTLRQLLALREYLLKSERFGTLDPVDDWIRMVALNRLTGHSSGFFSVYSLPPNQAVSLKAQKKINEKRGQTPPERKVDEIILKKTRSLLRDSAPPSRTATFSACSADSTAQLSDGSVDLTVTSPPFLDVVQYAADNWLRCWFAGFEADSIDIAMHKKPEDWTAFVAAVFRELGRVTKKGGHVAFEVGEVRNGSIALDELVLDAVAQSLFDPVAVIINVQEFTKTANCWGVSNNTSGTNTNRIVVARLPK